MRAASRATARTPNLPATARELERWESEGGTLSPTAHAAGAAARPPTPRPDRAPATPDAGEPGAPAAKRPLPSPRR
jgi:hypothetical protein